MRNLTRRLITANRFRRFFTFVLLGITLACYAVLLTIGALKASFASIGDHKSITAYRHHKTAVAINRLEPIDLRRRSEDVIVNPHPFEWVVLEKDICNNISSNSPLLLIVVHSDPAKIDFRSAIRGTWGSRVMDSKSGGGVETRVVFAMGSVSNLTLMREVMEESLRYRDIIQENFADSYKNLTYKAIMWMKWSAEYCKKAFQILKVDDDVFVNRFALTRLIRRLYDDRSAKSIDRLGRNRSITCHVWVDMPVIRDKDSKWYVSEQEYEGDKFTVYCSGGAYMISGDLAGLFYEKSLRTKFFWVDDVYATGMLRERANEDEEDEEQRVAYLDLPRHAYLIGEEELSKVENYTERVLFLHTFSRLEKIYYWWNNFTQEIGGIVQEANSTKRPSLRKDTKIPRIIPLTG